MTRKLLILLKCQKGDFSPHKRINVLINSKHSTCKSIRLKLNKFISPKKDKGKQKEIPSLILICSVICMSGTTQHIKNHNNLRVNFFFFNFVNGCLKKTFKKYHI